MTSFTPLDLRVAATACYIAVEETVANDLYAKLNWAADEIEHLQAFYNQVVKWAKSGNIHQNDILSLTEKKS
jgi:hypothetical protein